MATIICTLGHAYYAINSILYREILLLHVHLCAEYSLQYSVCVVSVSQKH